jgi:hypothetical protein
LTFFTINDPEEHIQIRNKIRKSFNFCVSADLDEAEEENESEQVKQVREGTAWHNNKEHKEASWTKKAFFWICGIEKSLEKKDHSLEEEVGIEKVDTSIDQEAKWASLCSITSVVVMALSGFTYAFFYKYE